jgi:hypothetical protein
MAPERRYLASFGDLSGVEPACALLAALPSGFRLIPLTAEDATASTVRYVQLPRLKAMQVRPSCVALTVGAADLWHTLGDLDFLKRARSDLETHLDAALTELRALATPDARFFLASIADTLPGHAMLDDVLVELARRHEATLAPGAAWPDLYGRQSSNDAM